MQLLNKGSLGKTSSNWTPAWEEEDREEIDEIKNKLVKRFGEERAERIADYNRNILIFPNLVINDIMAVTVRTYYPVEPDYMEVTGYSLSA